MLGILRRWKMTPFERAYIALYNGRIRRADFAKAAGTEDQEDAWRQLCEYRRRVIAGEIPDPRDVYDKWR